MLNVTINESKKFMANYTDSQCIEMPNEELANKCKAANPNSSAYSKYFSALFYKTANIINKAARGYERADDEDLIHFFNVALSEAVNSFEPNKGASFSTYLYTHYRRMLNPKMRYIKKVAMPALDEYIFDRAFESQDNIYLNIDSTTFLTSREKKIMRYIAMGYKVKEILNNLNICQQTLYNNIKKIQLKYKKYNISIIDCI